MSLSQLELQRMNRMAAEIATLEERLNSLEARFNKLAARKKPGPKPGVKRKKAPVVQVSLPGAETLRMNGER